MLKQWFDKLKAMFSKSKASGFTLIEVVIVLAIAGLIFVIVFLAVTQAQAARRDTQRKNAQSQLVAAANQYASNHAGNLPVTAWCGITDGTACAANAAPQGYWTPGTDPVGAAYQNVVAAIAGGAGNTRQYHFEASATCAADGSVAGGTARQFAVQIVLERGGAVCQDNQ